ncbi:hypothetical protein [Cupriavidus pauculus]|nr:hypothetical protein [Cupriavidus pauculus]
MRARVVAMMSPPDGDPHRQCTRDAALTRATSDLAVGEGRCAAPL